MSKNNLSDLTRQQLVSHILELRRQIECLKTDLAKYETICFYYGKLFNCNQTQQQFRLRQHLLEINSLNLCAININKLQFNELNDNIAHQTLNVNCEQTSVNTDLYTNSLTDSSICDTLESNSHVSRNMTNEKSECDHQIINDSSDDAFVSENWDNDVDSLNDCDTAVSDVICFNRTTNDNANTNLNVDFEVITKREVDCDNNNADHSRQNDLTQCAPLKKRLRLSLGECKVCGDIASGGYYGMQCCEACKKFFERSVLERKQYFCSGDKNCVITLLTRNKCQYCRYKKCVAVTQRLSEPCDDSDSGLADDKCANCYITSGVVRRPTLDGQYLCNSCALYRETVGKHWPSRVPRNRKHLTCLKCGKSDSIQWLICPTERNERIVCNACIVYYKVNDLEPNIKNRKRSTRNNADKLQNQCSTHDSNRVSSKLIANNNKELLNNLNDDETQVTDNFEDCGENMSINESHNESHINDSTNNDITAQQNNYTLEHIDISDESNRNVSRDYSHENSSITLHNKKYVCRHMGCERLFVSKKNLLRHRKIHAMAYINDGRKCTVDGCGIIFKTAKEFINHQIRKHPQLFPDMIWLECSEFGCAYRTKFERDYTRHQRYHERHRKNHREILKKKRKENLRKRMNIWKNVSNSGAQTFKCNHENCPGTFRTSRGLVKHIFYSHGGEELLVCHVDGCTYNNANVTKMRLHIQRHRGERQYVCDHSECAKAFVTKQDLMQHKQRHSTEKRYACVWPGCDKRFTTNGHLWQHHNQHKPVLKYQCDWPECGYGTAKKWNLDKHKATHTGVQKYACVWPECGYKTANQSNLKTHMKLHDRTPNDVANTSVSLPSICESVYSSDNKCKRRKPTQNKC